MAKGTITVDADGCYRIESNTLVFAPGIARAAHRAGPPPFNQEGQDTAAKLYWLAGFFPHVPACVLLEVIEGKYTVEDGVVAVQMRRTPPVAEPEPVDG